MPQRALPRLIALVLATVALAAPALAQMSTVAPYTVRVVTAQAEIRAGWGSDAWYSVGLVPQGTRLTVDGREGDWLRVRYPEDPGFGVLLRGRDSEIDEDSGTVTVARPARPVVLNRRDPVDGSWLKMTGEPIAPGTEFELLEIMGSPENVVFARVPAPERARGYVLAAEVERVDETAEEDTPEQDTDADSSEDPAEQTATHAEERPSEASDESSRDQPTAERAEPEQPADDEPLDQADAEDPAEGDETVERGPATPEQLSEAYRAVIAEPVESAELAPLMEEFRRAIEAAENDRVRERLRAQLQLLEIRRDLQDDLRALTNAADRAAREREAIDDLVIDWRSRPAYTLVGRLMASALYDGRRLPLMYRLQSLDGPGGRTIAYILPDENLDLNAKVGGVVGVVGQARRDRTINVRLIDPERVDVLEPGR